MKKLLLSLVMIGVSVVTIFQATSAAFEETVKVAGSSFTVVSTGPGGVNTALKMYLDVGGSNTPSNLDDQVAGPVFDNVSTTWTEDFPIKIYNQGSIDLDLISKSVYVSDPDTLRDDIYVSVLAWSDTNGNGLVDGGEVGQSFAYDTILRWRNDTFSLGTIQAGETLGFILRFDGHGVSDVNIGQQAVYDFEFTGVEVL